MPELNLQLGNLLSQIKQAKEKLDQKKAKRELGQLMTLYANIRVGSAQEQWEYHFKRHTELAQQFDQAATVPEYTTVFQKLGFIEATSLTTKQIEILQALEQVHIDEASPADRITIDKIEKLTTDTAKQAQQTIQALAKNYFHSLVSASIPWQERPEITEAIQFLKEAEHPKVLLLTGDAGIGKSAIVAKIAQELSNQDWLVLPFRLDILSPTYSAHQLGEQLGLPDSPVHALAEAALDQPCLLVIDQLDAVSMASGRHPQFFSVVRELIDEASLRPNIRVLLACREFDLNNDDRFQQLIEVDNPIAKQLHINELTEEQVQYALGQKAFRLTAFTDKQIKLLQNPLYLNLFLVNKPTEAKAFDFQSLTDLYDLFWKQKQRILNFNLAEALSPLAEEMSNTMGLSLPDTILDHIPQQAEILLSEGILRQEGHKIAFFHESFFDYVYARRFLAENQDLFNFLLADEQHLFRRAQVRQVLTMLRQKDQKRYLKTIDELLHLPDVRFHIKELVLRLLSNWPDPSDGEWKILKKCLHNSDPDVASSCKETLRRSSDWNKYIIDHCLLKQLFESEKQYEQEVASNTLEHLLKSNPDSFIDFATPYLETFDKLYQNTPDYTATTDHLPSTPDIIKRLYHNHKPFTDRFWKLLIKLSKIKSKWGIYGLALLLQKQIDHLILHDEIQSLLPSKKPISRKLNLDKKYIKKTLTQCIEAHPKFFTQHIMPKILSLAKKSAKPQSKEVLIKDHLWHYGDCSNIRDERNFTDFLLIYLINALSQLTPEQFSIYQPLLKKSRLVLAQYLLIKGYTAHPKDFADQAIDNLCTFPERLFLYEQGSQLQLCTQLLQAITPHASPTALQKLEQLIMNDPKPKKPTLHASSTTLENFKQLHMYENLIPKSPEQKGWIEYALLMGISADRRSAEAQSRFEELKCKFLDQDPSVIESLYWHGPVDSPLSIEACQTLTDEQWLMTIQKYDNNDQKYHPDGRITGGASELAQILGIRAQAEPERFAKLALLLPDNTNTAYFEQLIIHLTQTELDPTLTLQVAKRCHALPDQPCGRWIPQLFSKRPDIDWPDEALQIVADHALKHPDPKEDYWNHHAPNCWRHPDYWVNHDYWNYPNHWKYSNNQECFFAGTHSVRGSAALSIDSLLSAKTERFDFFRPIIEKMIHDPITAVRTCTAVPVSRILKINPELALKWFLQLTDTHDEFLKSPYAYNFLKDTYAQHFTTIRPIIERMLQSEDEEVAGQGAALACLSAFTHTEAKDLAQQARTGSRTLRYRAAKIYIDYLNRPFATEQCTQYLPLFLNDPDKGVRIATENFMWLLEPKDETAKLIDLNKHQALLKTFMDKQKSYSNIIFFSPLRKLLLLFYTQQLNHSNPDPIVLKLCLNFFDQMIRQHPWVYEKDFKELDRA